MHTRSLALLLLVAFTCQVFANDPRPSGKNCDLSEPPKEAGEIGSYGIWRVYPRIASISAKYSGCQLMWFDDRDGEVPLVYTLLEVKDGHAVRSWHTNFAMLKKEGAADLGVPKDYLTSQSQTADDLLADSCRYDGGKLVPEAHKKCPVFLNLIPSLPAGCVSKRTAGMVCKSDGPEK